MDDGATGELQRDWTSQDDCSGCRSEKRNRQIHSLSSPAIRASTHALDCDM